MASNCPIEVIVEIWKNQAENSINPVRSEEIKGSMSEGAKREKRSNKDIVEGWLTYSYLGIMEMDSLKTSTDLRL